MKRKPVLVIHGGTGVMPDAPRLRRIRRRLREIRARAHRSPEGGAGAVEAAKALLEEEDRILAGLQAIAYARSLGLGDWDPVTPQRRRQLEQLSQGTVGAVALDEGGRRAGAIALDASGRFAWDTTLPVLLAAARTRRGYREAG